MDNAEGGKAVFGASWRSWRTSGSETVFAVDAKKFASANHFWGGFANHMSPKCFHAFCTDFECTIALPLALRAEHSPAGSTAEHSLGPF